MQKIIKSFMKKIEILIEEIMKKITKLPKSLPAGF